LKIVTS